jgi:hypothetical protein
VCHIGAITRIFLDFEVLNLMLVEHVDVFLSGNGWDNFQHRPL